MLIYFKISFDNSNQRFKSNYQCVYFARVKTLLNFLMNINFVKKITKMQPYLNINSLKTLYTYSNIIL